MKNTFNLILIIVIAILLGVGATVKMTGDKVVQRLIMQQAQIVSSQKKIEKQLSSASFVSETGEQKAPVVANTTAHDSNLEKRLTTLERKVDGLVMALKANQKAQPQRPSIPKDEYTKVHKIDVAHSPIKGNKDARVTITEFLDFQCPFCSRFHAVIGEVLKAYPEDVNYVLKNYPLKFHPQGKPAAKAAFAAGEQGKYWEMVDLLLENHKSLNDEKFEELAKSLGLNMKKFKKDYKDRDAEWEKLIMADMALGQKVSVRGTPTFYINGRKTQARDLNRFKKEIDEILEKK